MPAGIHVTSSSLGLPRFDGQVLMAWSGYLCVLVLILVGGCLVFGWGEVAEGGVEPAAVVPGDVVDDGTAGEGVGGPGLLVDAFAFQRGEERFGDGVVPALPGPADRQGHSAVVGEGGVLPGRVLTAADALLCVKWWQGEVVIVGFGLLSR